MFSVFWMTFVVHTQILYTKTYRHVYIGHGYYGSVEVSPSGVGSDSGAQKCTG